MKKMSNERIDMFGTVAATLFGCAVNSDQAIALSAVLCEPEVDADGHRVNWATAYMGNRYCEQRWVSPPIIGADLASCTGIKQFHDFLEFMRDYKYPGAPIVRFTAGLLALLHYKPEWSTVDTEFAKSCVLVGSLLSAGNVLSVPSMVERWGLPQHGIETHVTNVLKSITDDPKDGRAFFATKAIAKAVTALTDINQFHMLHVLVREFGPKLSNRCSTPNAQARFVMEFFWNRPSC